MDDTQGKNPEEGKVGEIQPQEIPAETKPAESEEPTLPDQVAERTKEEFEKLKQHNAELKQKLSTYEDKTSVLDDLRPQQAFPNLTPTQVQEVENSLVDQNGFVDVNRLNLMLKEANDRAKQAEAKADQADARVQNFEETAQVRAAHAKYPSLDPHNTEGFDPKFYEAVRNELVGQMMNGKRDIVEAADKVSQWFQPKVDVSKAKEEAVKEYKEKVTKRDQATSISGARGQEIPSEREELIEKTKQGDNLALYKRLQASGY